MARSTAIRFKLPLAFLQAHKDVLDAQDWTRNNLMDLGVALPEIAALAGVNLEAIARNREIIVRCVDGPSMLKLRKYADGLESA
jgi:hypothetical protein